MDYPQYVVQPGDTIYKISKTYNVDMSEIIQLNHLKYPDRIYPGQVLLIPVMENTEPPFKEIPEPNLTYAIWLYDAYAGKDSELSAVTTYLYQTVILDHPDIDNLLRPIAYDELRHLETLGHILRQLGVDPRYGSFRKGHWVDWRSRYVDYSTDLRLILENNMKDEARDYNEYMELARKIPLPEIQTLLTQMACDEERHCRCFAEALQHFCGICVPCPILPPEMPPMQPETPPFEEPQG